MVSVIVATLNNREHAARLIDALSQVRDIPLRLIAVDNGSTDGTVEWLRTMPVTVIDNEKNLGAAAAWNLGLRVAVANNADAVLLCGNDTAPMPGTVERLYGLLQQGVLFVTGTQVPYDTPVTPVDPVCPADQCLVAAPDFSFAMFRPVVLMAIGQWDAAVAHQVTQQAQQAGQPLPAAVMEPWSWGYFDARYTLGYGEDNDYHMRAKHAGVPLLRDEGALFRHDCSLTIRTHPELAEVNQRENFRRNMELFKAKWGDVPANLDVPQARPGNVTDEQWAALSGNRAVIELPRDEAVAAARAVYARYGISA